MPRVQVPSLTPSVQVEGPGPETDRGLRLGVLDPVQAVPGQQPGGCVLVIARARRVDAPANEFLTIPERSGFRWNGSRADAVGSWDWIQSFRAGLDSTLAMSA